MGQGRCREVGFYPAGQPVSSEEIHERKPIRPEEINISGVSAEGLQKHEDVVRYEFELGPIWGQPQA